MSNVDKLAALLFDATARATDASRAWERNPSDMLRPDYRVAVQDQERLERLLTDARRSAK